MKSDAHKRAQEIIRDYYLSKTGWVIFTEHFVNGKKRVDVLAQEIKTKRTIGLEIQTSFKHTLENIRLDLGVCGCHEVVIVCLDIATLKEVRRRTMAGLDKNLIGKVKFHLLEQYIPHVNNSNNREYTRIKCGS